MAPLKQRTIIDENTLPMDANDKVTHLTTQRKPILIMVYGKHCFHCHEFKPTWDQAADLLESRTALRTLTMEASALSNTSSSGNVNTAATQLMDDLYRDVHGVPYVALRHGDGSMDKFNGERSMASILLFVNDSLHTRRPLPKSKPITNQQKSSSSSSSSSVKTKTNKSKKRN